MLSPAFPYEILILTVHKHNCLHLCCRNIGKCAYTYVKTERCVFIPLMDWNFEDHFEDSKGPGPQGHDAIAGFFGLKAQPLHNILGRNATSNLYIHIHTQIQRWWRATSSVLKERGHACAVATHISVRVGPHRRKI